MRDLKVIAIQDILEIYGVSMYSKRPPTLRISGKDLNQASVVYINDLPSPEFIVLSGTTLLAQIPDGQESSIVRSIKVMSTSPSLSRRSVLHFEIGRTFKTLNGLERLVQSFCKILLQTPGSDKFDPVGGGLLAMVGRNIDRGLSSGLEAEVMSSIRRTKEYIQRKQARNPRIPPDERLLQAEPEGVGYDPSNTSLGVRILIAAVSGQAAVANITL